MSTAQLSPAPVFRSWDNLGFPLVGGKLFTYAAGTSTPQATYTDSTGNTPNTNPVILNFRGEAFVWLNPLQSYKFVLQDAFGNLIWTEDNIQGAIGVASNIVPAVTNTYTLGTPAITFANGYFGPNGAAVFDPVSGNIGYYARTIAEIAASVTPVNYAFKPAHPMRYGAAGTGLVDDHAALQIAANVSGAGGGTVPLNDGYRYLCNADITVPTAATFAAPVASFQGNGLYPTVIFGTGSTFGFIQLGAGATTGGTTSTNYNYAATFRDLGVELTGSANTAFYCNSVNQPKIERSWVVGSGTNGRAAYFLNCLVPVFEDCLVTGCGSATQFSVEFDLCTSLQWRGSRISGGNTTKGGLAIDRCTNTLVDGCASESCGIPIVISSKAESAIPNTTIVLRGLELENPGNGNQYIDIGSGLSGSALVLDIVLNGWYGSPSGTTSMPSAVRARNFVGFEVRGSHFTLPGSPTCCFDINNTNSSGVVIGPHRNLSSLGIPWVNYVGVQVFAAGPHMEWQLGELQSSRPLCTSRGLEGAYDGTNLTGTNPTIAIPGGMGGFYASKVVSNGSATTMTLAGGEPGMLIKLLFADTNTTLSIGGSAGQFLLKSGQANPPAAGSMLWFFNDGQNGSAGSRWTQL